MVSAYGTAICELGRDGLLAECLRQHDLRAEADRRMEAVRVALRAISDKEGAEGMTDADFVQQTLALVNSLREEI